MIYGHENARDPKMSLNFKRSKFAKNRLNCASFNKQNTFGNVNTFGSCSIFGIDHEGIFIIIISRLY